MIIVKIVGGLASQLQKYAFGRALALKHGCELKLDLTWFENIPEGVTKRKYMLDLYNINATVATKREIKRLIGHKYILINLWHQACHNLLFKNTYMNENFVSVDVYGSLGDDVYCEGEWFGAKYYEKYKSILQQELRLKNDISPTASEYDFQIGNSNSVALHVRRGDFIQCSEHSLCNEDYFKQAIATIGSKISDPVYYIFSDDLEWAKATLEQLVNKAVFITGTKDYEEFFLISRCKHAIISNSGFSWFSSWLNLNDDNIIIAPKRWFDDEELNAKMLLSLDDKVITL